MPAPSKYPGLTRAGEGRPRGSQNRATREMRQFIEKFLRSAAYRQSIQKRILEGKAVPIEVLMWDHLYGKVRAQVAIEASVRPEGQVRIYLPAKDNYDGVLPPVVIKPEEPRALPPAEDPEDEADA